MKNLIRLTLKVLPWAFLIFIGYFVWIIGVKLLLWIRLLDAGVATAVVTGILGLVGLLYSQWHSKSRDIAENHRPKKIEVYDTFLEIVDSFIDAENEGTKIGKVLPKDLQSKMKSLNRGMIIWASSKVIRTWLKFRNEVGKTDTHSLYYVDNVLRASRNDLGNSNFGLTRGDIVSLYLSHPSEIKKLPRN